MSITDSFATIILAAGKGTRIEAIATNKVLFPLAGRPMIGYITQALKTMGIEPILVVVGYKKEQVMDFLGKDYLYVDQGELLGTADAVRKAITELGNRAHDVLVLYGDHSAFYLPKMLKKLLTHHKKTRAVMTFLTVDKSDPTGYGRILRDQRGKIKAIREHKHASVEERKIKEINTGAYCFQVDFLKSYLPKINKNPEKGEYYLTDLVDLALKQGLVVETIKVKDVAVSFGVNTRQELEQADEMMQRRLKK